MKICAGHADWLAFVIFLVIKVYTSAFKSISIKLLFNELNDITI